MWVKQTKQESGERLGDYLDGFVQRNELLEGMTLSIKLNELLSVT